MFEYNGKTHTLQDLEKSRIAQNYSGTIDEFIQMYRNNGMKDASTKKDDYYSDKEFSFGPAIDRELVNITARGIGSFASAIKGIGEYGVALEIGMSDWYGSNIKGETEEEAAERKQRLKQQQETDSFRPSVFLEPVIETLKKAI